MARQMRAILTGYRADTRIITVSNLSHNSDDLVEAHLWCYSVPGLPKRYWQTLQKISAHEQKLTIGDENVLTFHPGLVAFGPMSHHSALYAQYYFKEELGWAYIVTAG